MTSGPWRVTRCNVCGRDTEDELAKVADERDDAKKEREEVKWQARQAEKRATAAEEELDAVQQVRPVRLGYPAVTHAHHQRLKSLLSVRKAAWLPCRDVR